MKYLHLVLTFLCLFHEVNGLAEDREAREKSKNLYLESRSLSYTFSLLADDFAEDLTEKVNQPLATILSKVTLSSNLPSEFENYAILKFVDAVTKTDKHKIIKCVECDGFNIDLRNGEVLLKKGIEDKKQLTSLLDQYKASSYAEMDISLLGNNLVLNVSIYNRGNDTAFYTNQVQRQILSIRDDGLTFGIAAGTLVVSKDDTGTVVGGKLQIAQRISRFGDLGLRFSSFTSKEIKGISGMGVMVDLSYNELMQRYWSYGSLYFTNEFGMAFYKNNGQMFYSPGAKLRLGTVFYMTLSAYIFKVLKLKKPTDADTAATPSVIDDKKDFPISFFLGVGVDLG